jgi:hypothetical protein
MSNQNFIIEPERKTLVYCSADVVVAGGGTAGVAAAIRAARLGLKTVLIERASMPGGMLTQVVKTLEDHANKGGIVKELLAFLHSENSWEQPFYNPFILVPWLDSRLEEVGVNVLYLVTVVGVLRDGNNLRGVIVEGKSGRQAILASTIIDATGDGDVAVIAGAAYHFGRPSDQACQAITLSSLLTNYKGQPLSGKELTALVEQHSDYGYSLPFTESSARPLPGDNGTVWHAIPHATGRNPVDMAELSEALVMLRKQSWHFFRFARDRIPEFEACLYGPVSSLPGVRESRRIVCEKNISAQDARTGRKHDDGIITVTWPMSIHKHDESDAPLRQEPVKPYHVPYGALLPKGVDNLLVVGRCIGGDHEAMASYRIACNCLGIGEAAAVATFLAKDSNCKVREINRARLQAEMENLGYEL